MISLNPCCPEPFFTDSSPLSCIKKCRQKLITATHNQEKVLEAFDRLIGAITNGSLTNEEIQKICLAIEFVLEKYQYKNDIYNGTLSLIIRHLEVAYILANENKEISLHCLLTAVLHGVLENKQTNLKEIEQVFDSSFANTLQELNHQDELDKEMTIYQQLIYRQNQLNRICKLSYAAIVVILAEKLYHLRNLPEEWSYHRRCSYAYFVDQILKIIQERRIHENLPPDFSKTLQTLKSLLLKQIDLILQNYTNNFFVKSRY